MPNKKRIAITVSVGAGQFKLNQQYMDLINNAGYEPVMITKHNDVKLQNIQGIILPGGEDINPNLYGQDNYSSFSVNIDRDDLEINLFREAKFLNIPIFGICRGFQLIALEYLRENKGEKAFRFSQHINKHNQKDNEVPRNVCFHYVVMDGEALYGEASIKGMFVNSMHHQGVSWQIKEKRLVPCEGIEPLAWCARGNAKDTNILEAFDWGEKIRAVQWHPEELNDIKLIQTFFK